VSQKIETPSGSYFHAIMHRMEGDFGNAKYWYARCQNHPVLPVIGASAKDIVARAPLDKAALRLTLQDWSGPAFVDTSKACTKARATNATRGRRAAAARVAGAVRLLHPAGRRRMTL
jgi:hypothetical protein